MKRETLDIKYMNEDMASYRDQLDNHLKQDINNFVFLSADPRMTLSKANKISEDMYHMFFEETERLDGEKS